MPSELVKFPNMLKKFLSFIILIHCILIGNTSIPGSFSITRIHYGGGGDWYSDPSSLSNLLEFLDLNTNIVVNPIEKKAKIGDDTFLSSSYFYLTGHGNIKFNEDEVLILRDQLFAGAFLHADDNYGMDESFRREMKRVFPEKEWIKLPLDHPIFNIHYKFANGLPKIHEHDRNPPEALGLFNKGTLMVLYTFESDLGDGWENSKVHGNPENIRMQALQMGTNIIIYSMSR